jgi:hypothetical protein
MILLNIQGLFVEINSEESLLSRIRCDFEYFIAEKYTQGPLLKVSAEFTSKIPLNIIPKNLKPLFQRHNSITYEENGKRYNDYYGSVLSVFEAKKSEAVIYGSDIDKLYEVLYLFILSRSGKHGDLTGTHRIHAFAVVKNYAGIICMQPMRGGKSTLFTELLLNQNVEIVSDDTPIINTSGDLIPFPLRVSLDAIPPQLNLNENEYYLMKREFYKAKYSISLKAFKKPIAQKCNYFIFTEAHRSTYDFPYVKRMSPLRLFKSLFKHMVVGVGLPIIFEYFWESGKEDFLRKTIIFFKRLTLALRLSFSHKGYDVYLTADSKKNAEVILNLI